MKGFYSNMSVLILSTITASVLAAPVHLITHNTTDVESNALIAGTIPSQHPTKAHSDGKVLWTGVKLACFGHITGGHYCSALIKMATNTANPIEVGTLTLDLNTGDVTPKLITANGYTITVNGPGETTLSKD